MRELADDVFQRFSAGGNILAVLELPRGDEAPPLRSAGLVLAGQIQQEHKLINALGRLVQVLGQEPGQFLPSRDVIGVLLQLLDARSRRLRCLGAVGGRFRLRRGLIEMIAQRRQGNGLGDSLFPQGFGGGGLLIDTELRHAGKMRAPETVREHLQSAPGGVRVTGDFQVPIRQPI